MVNDEDDEQDCYCEHGETCSWTKNKLENCCDDSDAVNKVMRRLLIWILVTLTVLLFIVSVGLIFWRFCYFKNSDGNPPQILQKNPENKTEMLRKISLQTWTLLNIKNNETYDAEEPDLSPVLQKSNSGDAESRKSWKQNCCTSEKYLETISSPGCTPIQIVNRHCKGQCVSVWIPGIFSSFPTCQPSRSHWKSVRLKCANGKKKLVRVRKIRKCSCMEDPKKQNGN